MEIEDLSELCRLCLESSTVLIPFDTTLHFSTKSIPELIKYCVDLKCNFNDGGITPKNVCQACLDKLQLIHEFKWKSHESDKYLKQIISHSGIMPQAEEHDITPYNPPDLHSSMFHQADDEDEDENSLLTPMEPAMGFDYTEQLSSAVEKGLELRKGQRHGEFHCRICNKYFKYVKPYKNHIKLHKNTPKKISYYKRKKLLAQQEAAASAALSMQIRNNKKTPQMRTEPQAQYDSLSPYNSPAPYEKESMALHTNRDSSPDFGEFLLQTSRHLLNGGDDDEDNLRPANNHRSKASDDVDYSPRKQPRAIAAKKTAEVIVPDSPLEKRSRGRPGKSTNNVTIEEEEPPPKRPGPLSKTRGKTKTKEQEEEEEVAIEGFSEVDISKMLKKKKDKSDSFADDASQSQSSHRTRSDRSPSIELIQEVDIFGRG